MTTMTSYSYKKVGGVFFKFFTALRTPSSFLSIILLAVAISMTACVTTDEKPCCKQQSQPCCKEGKPCCKDTIKIDSITIVNQLSNAPQL